jgi:hypothetical protein
LSRSRDFWLASGHHLLDRAAAGRLVVTDELLKAYLALPELVPSPEGCPAERKLHDALLREIVARWLSPPLAIDLAVEPLTELRNAPLSWYVGLDSEATRIGDAIRNGEDLDDATRARLIGLCRLTFRNPADMIEKVRGEPVYLLAATAADQVLRLKPQNLVAGLPVRHAEAVH